MVANSQSRTSSRDDDVTMSPIHNDMTMQVENTSCSLSTLDCPHCDFKCDSSTMMTQHSWEQHPLLMRRKKHLITTVKQPDMLNGAVAMHDDVKVPVSSKHHEKENHQLSENGNASCDVTTQEKSPLEETSIDYREKAMRSISLLSTAAAILESQSILSQERHHPTAKMPTQESAISASPYQLETVQPFMAPLYRAYVPSLNQYVTIPINMTPISNPSSQNPLVQYLHVQQQRNAGFSQMSERAPTYPCYPTSKPPMANLKPQSPPKQPTDEIRNLLTTSNAPATEKDQTRRNPSPRKVPKSHRSKQTAQSNSKNGNACPLGEERRKQLEEALLSMDYCDINDTSTTMPFKCSDGVWRMVKFKCIKGLWVVQTPQSTTPTVYVPCDDDQVQSKTINNGRQKRKLSEDLDFEIDSKRLCASAPVLPTKDSGEAHPRPLKRTLSNPFMTKQLPAPSQYFTSNEGKRVNISVVKRGTTSSSSNLIKSLLLRKPSPVIMTSPSGSSTSSVDEKMTCRHTGSKTTGIATTLSKTLLKSSMAF